LTVVIAEIAIIIFTFLNFFHVSHLGWISNFGAFLQIFTVVVVLVGLLAAASSLNSINFVLTDYNNETGWSSVIYVSGLGLLSSLFGFSGYEASAHMAEETVGSRTAASYGIINTCLASGLLGLLYLLTLLFVTTNIDDALNGTTSVATVNVYLSAGGIFFGNFLAWLLVLNISFAGEPLYQSPTNSVHFTFIRRRNFHQFIYEELSCL